MVAHDISRHLFRPANHYTGLRMQQGRVTLDSDFNEARTLDDEGQRLFVRDVIGPHGTPDNGFNIAIAGGPFYNFTIGNGTYYLGGLRHEISGSQTFRSQSDWRQWNRTGGDPALPFFPDTEGLRHDLVYLVGWEQGVTSVEDDEFREKAITAQDTGYRIRRMHRVQVRTAGPADCSGTFAALVDELTAGIHTFDHANNELLSAARLTVTYDPAAVGSFDLCTPKVLQGFSGGENETIRVQLMGAQRFLWSIDNAAPLYRVTVAHDLNEATITFAQTTIPRDAAHHPRVGQVIELLPWGADLSNGEHVADHPIAPHVGGGVYARVTTPYDPETRTFTALLSDAGTTTLAAMIAWFGVVEDPYLFARIWNPGDTPADEFDTEFGVPFEPGVPVRLSGTGFRVTFAKAGILGDHWILATRPETTHDVVPWDLATGAAPHGPRRFYSPLAIIHWNLIVDGDLQVLGVEFHDCRRTFRPLTRIRGCCTVTVGDGTTSFGDFTTIKDAVAAIPIDEPGKVCILPGTYEERVVLSSRENLVLEGCGARTILRTHTSNATSKGLITLLGCSNITLRSFNIEARGQFGVMTNYSNSVRIDRVNIRTRRDPDIPYPANLWIPSTASPFPLSTIAWANGTDLSVVNCELAMIGELSAVANVTAVTASRVRINGCRISTPGLGGHVSVAWGGIHLINVYDVELADNHIEDGLGHGITFGVYFTTIPPDDLAWFDPGGRFEIDTTNDCPSPEADMPLGVPPVGGGPDIEVLPSYNQNIRILRNRISGMGGSGISVLGFWPDTADPYPMIETHDLVIDGNIIENNYRTPPQAPRTAEYIDVVAFGGIALAAADRLQVRDNLIQNNGADFRAPACGVYVLTGENIAIENNLIRNNGPRIADTALSGIRAGIALQLVGRHIAVDGDVELDSLLPAARIRGNVVEQPAGRALQLHGIGPMFIEGNTLISEGLASGTSATIPHCIDIHNVGQSPELLLEGVIPADIAYFPAPLLLYGSPDPSPELIDGRILFTDNQVRFAPAAGTANNIFVANRFQSYGDVAILDNQFLVLFPPEGGSMVNDTAVVAWTTRTNNNRWEDPHAVVSGEGSTAEYETDTSATTLAFLNFTTLNQASRCIHAAVSSSAPPDSLVADNHTFTNCDVVPGLAPLLEAP